MATQATATRGQSYRAPDIQLQPQACDMLVLDSVPTAIGEQGKAGQMMGTIEEKTQQVKNKAGESAQGAKDKLSGATQGAKDGCSGDGASHTKEHAGGIIQATTEQIKRAAAGAAGIVKNTLGMGGTTQDDSNVNRWRKA